MSKSKRLDPTPSTLRQLYLASGGFCAMSDCKKHLIDNKGTWIGTVSHIVSAEDGGPRADPNMSPNERRAFQNLVLLCANHGREVDDKKTGETIYPRSRLQKIKSEHEAKFAKVLDAMVLSAHGKPPTSGDFIDANPRPSSAPGSASRFFQHIMVDDNAELSLQVNEQLRDCHDRLSHVSDAALGTLSVLIALWEETLKRDGAIDFDDPSAGSPSIHNSHVTNRGTDRNQLESALAELADWDLIFLPDPDDPRSEQSFSLNTPWRDPRSDDFTTWHSIGKYLQQTEQGRLSDWVKELDFQVFD
jgi:hypothetical protein